MKKLLNIFAVAFLLNFIWENAQAPLYQGYISFWQHFWICLPASLWDAGYVTLLYLAIALVHRDWFWFPKINNNKRSDRYVYCYGAFTIAIIAVSLTIATIIEWNALAKGKWAYSAAMPLVPIIHVGLTPFLQLAILSLVTYTVVEIGKKRSSS